MPIRIRKTSSKKPKTKKRSGTRKSDPLRFHQNTKQTYLNTKAVNLIKGITEKKLSALTELDEQPAVPVQVGALAYKYNIVLGSQAPSSWTGGYTPVSGFTFPQSLGSQGRDGRYMYLDKTTINMSIHMNARERLTAPTQFRMLIFRARRSTTPTGVSYDPNDKLFLDSAGSAFGPGTPGFNFNDGYLQPTNKRDWIIVLDKKFTLSPFLADGTGNTAAWQGMYPNFKTMRIILNHKKKTAFQSSTNEPQDYDYHYGMLIIAGTVGRDQVADGWEVNLRGTTSAIDN